MTFCYIFLTLYSSAIFRNSSTLVLAHVSLSIAPLCVIVVEKFLIMCFLRSSDCPTYPYASRLIATSWFDMHLTSPDSLQMCLDADMIVLHPCCVQVVFFFYRLRKNAFV